jgi:IPT/TIG domain/NHL repeat
MGISRGAAAMMLFVCALLLSSHAQAVTITDISPLQATAGTIVTITGTGFSTTKADDTITFVGHNLPAKSATATKLTVAIPVDWSPSTATVKVTVTGQTAVVSTMKLSVLGKITSISPTTVNVGDNLTIDGTNLAVTGSWIQVYFTGGVNTLSSSFYSSATEVQVTVPAGAQSGPVWFVFNSGTVTSSQNLTVIGSGPSITGMSVSQGVVGDAVTLTGVNFSATPSANTVKFNGVAAVVTASTATSITTRVPPGATTGPISVTVGTLTGNSPSNFTITCPSSEYVSTPPEPSVYSTGMAMDSSNNLYVSAPNEILRVDSAGVSTVLAGNTSPGSADGAGSVARFNDPTGVAIDSSGNVFVADTENYTIRKITPAGVVSTLAGSAGVSGTTDGTGAAARFSGPQYLTVDGSGNVYVTDKAYVIRKISPSGVVITVAGTAGVQGAVDGTGATARFSYLNGIVIDTSGNLFVADSNAIRKITPAGVVTTFAGALDVRLVTPMALGHLRGFGYPAS